MEKLALQERVRALHGELLKLACSIHPVARLVDAVAQGLSSKSNRTRIVCTDALAEVLRDYGLDAFQPARSRPFHLIAQVGRPRFVLQLRTTAYRSKDRKPDQKIGYSNIIIIIPSHQTRMLQ